MRQLPSVQEVMAHFISVSYYKKWVTTSWTYSMRMNEKFYSLYTVFVFVKLFFPWSKAMNAVKPPLQYLY